MVGKGIKLFVGLFLNCSLYFQPYFDYRQKLSGGKKLGNFKGLLSQMRSQGYFGGDKLWRLDVKSTKFCLFNIEFLRFACYFNGKDSFRTFSVGITFAN